MGLSRVSTVQYNTVQHSGVLYCSELHKSCLHLQGKEGSSCVLSKIKSCYLIPHFVISYFLSIHFSLLSFSFLLYIRVHKLMKEEERKGKKEERKSKNVCVRVLAWKW